MTESRISVIVIIMTKILIESLVLGKDICFGQQSRLSCGRGEVIMMTSAEYGHMEEGQCIREIAPGYGGCSDDVLPVFDKWCSGKKECNIDTNAEELKETNINCPRFILKYTRLQYRCIEVKSTCTSNTITDAAGYVSSYIADTRRCGTIATPWKISANPGQIIQLELIDFNVDRPKTNIVSCRVVYGFVLERSLGINHTICGGTERQMALYISKTNFVEIQLLKNDKRGAGEFLIKYEVIGCAELSPPPHAWYKREGNKAIIGCEDNDKEWIVTCIGNRWEGEIGNCTKSVIVMPPVKPHQQHLGFKSVVIMAGIIGCAVVLSVVAIVVGVVYVKKYRMHQETKRAALVHKTYSTMDRNIQAYYRPVTMEQSIDNRTLLDIPASTDPEEHTLSSADQCTCATLQMRNNVDNDKRTEITSLERQSLYSSIKSNL